MHIEPRISLVFNGECDAALTLYRECLGATVTFRLTWGDSPMAEGAPVEWRDKILHATMTIGGTASRVATSFPVSTNTQGFQLHLKLVDVAEAERIFSQLADGGGVTAPLQKTFWAKRFGGVIDRFGIPWGINCGEAEVHKRRRLIRSRPR